MIPILALAFVALTSALRIERVRYVSGLEGWSAAESSEWQPRLIVPGNQSSSFEWLDQTRQMLATGEFRIRHIDYENAPSGHDVSSPSPYRWWLGLLAWICHLATGQPMGGSLETAALFADPLLNALLLLAAAGFVAWRFGLVASALVSVALATLYPLAVGFLPGAPDDQSLSIWAILWSVLPLSRALGPENTRSFGFPSRALRAALGFG